METVNMISLILFLLFFLSYSAKLIVLKNKNGIKANVLGKKGKSKEINMTETFVRSTTLIWGVLWFAYAILDRSFTESYIVQYAGITTLAIGVFLFILAMLSMKTSWRVGIDKATKSELVTTGIYQFSRNPAFVGFDLMFFGFVLTYPNLLSLLVAVLNFIAIHRLILQEEKHLEAAFQDSYKRYRSATPRYLIFRDIKNNCL